MIEPMTRIEYDLLREDRPELKLPHSSLVYENTLRGRNQGQRVNKALMSVFGLSPTLTRDELVTKLSAQLLSK